MPRAVDAWERGRLAVCVSLCDRDTPVLVFDNARKRAEKDIAARMGCIHLFVHYERVRYLAVPLDRPFEALNAARSLASPNLTGLQAAVFWPAHLVFRLDDDLHRCAMADVSAYAV